VPQVNRKRRIPPSSIARLRLKSAAPIRRVPRLRTGRAPEPRLLWRRATSPSPR
jgi:hypothetical protein